MLETLLVVWRESLEAALIVGILLTYLGRSGQRAGARYVWGGSLAALLAASVCAAASSGLVAGLDGDTQELVQVGVLLVAVAVLTWMVVWMHRHARALRGELERKADAALAKGRLIGLATIAFAAVFREAVETVLFLWGIGARHAGMSALLVLAGAGGALLAAGTAWLFFSGFRFLRLPTFFRVTGVLLVLVAAGLLSSAVNKLIGLGYLSPLMPQVWNSSWLVRDDSLVGRTLSALMGYRSRPSLLEVLAYAVYFLPVLWCLRRADGTAASSASPA